MRQSVKAEFNKIKKLLEEQDRAYLLFLDHRYEKVNNLLNTHLKDVNWSDEHALLDSSHNDFEFYANMYWKLYYKVMDLITEMEVTDYE